MKPILYSSTETTFGTNGIGILSDAISCVVTEERNGVFELEMTHPVDGLHHADISLRSIILANPNRQNRPQPFRIYDMSQPMNGVVTIYAQHISYDLNGIPVRPFSAASAPEAMQFLRDNAVVACPFSFFTDKTTTATFTVPYPSTIRSKLGGSSGSLLDVYGGEYRFDRYDVHLLSQRGKDSGVTLRYGKNLTNIQQDKNCENVYTGVYPYWAGSDGAYVELPEKIVAAEGSYDFSRILPVDFSGDWDEAPTEEKLRARAQKYTTDNNIGIPTVSITASFVELAQTEEYKEIAPLEAVALCDTVGVYFQALGVVATAKIIKTVYNVLVDKYESVEIGEARSNIAATIAQQNSAIAQVPQTVMDGLTSTQIFNKLTDNGRIQGIYIQDNKWYINAEVAQIYNLIAESVSSKSDLSEVQITGAALRMLFGDDVRMTLNNSADGVPYLSMQNGDYKMQLTSNTFNLGGLECLGSEIPLKLLLFEDKESGTVLAHQIGANHIMTTQLSLGENGAGFILSSEGMASIAADAINISGNGNCEWVYDSALGRTVLALKDS